MPIINKQPEEMTLDEAIYHLHVIDSTQKTYKQDEAVRFATAVLEALRAGLVPDNVV